MFRARFTSRNGMPSFFDKILPSSLETLLKIMSHFPPFKNRIVSSFARATIMNGENSLLVFWSEENRLQYLPSIASNDLRSSML